MKNPPNDSSRRNFLKNVALGGAGIAISSALPDSLAAAEATPHSSSRTMIGVPFEPHARVRVGLVGCGLRGNDLLGDLLNIPEVDITALCDIVPEKVAAAQKRVVASGRKEPAGYSKGDHDFENLSKRDDLDIVYTATPWQWHTPVAVSAMLNGHHAATEVPAAYTLEDCWKLVETSEKTRRHCIMLENCCYGYNEMLILNMVRAGKFGELTHGEAAYIHDLRKILTEGANEGLWRRDHHTQRNSNLYPTHGLGPVARYMNINRGDRFIRLVSMASLEANLSTFVKSNFPDGDPKRKERYLCGDMNTSLIQTAKGRTIMLQHDVVSPRPYDRINMISGTRGTFRDYPARIFVDGQPKHEWQTLDAFKDKWEDPLWKTQGEMARKLGGHGGMDFIMNWRLIDCMRNGLVPDMDVYDAAAWSAPGPLSQTSIARNSAPQEFPDFTRGKALQARS